MKDMLFLGGILLAVFVGVPLFNSLMQHIAATGGTVHPTDPARADDPDEDERRSQRDLDWSDHTFESGWQNDFSVQGKPKMGGVTDEDGYY